MAHLRIITNGAGSVYYRARDPVREIAYNHGEVFGISTRETVFKITKKCTLWQL